MVGSAICRISETGSSSSLPTPERLLRFLRPWTCGRTALQFTTRENWVAVRPMRSPGALEFDAGRQGLPVSTPSRLFIYYNERAMEGTVGSDSGAQLRDGIKSVAQWGDCPETEWPYDVNQFAVEPPQSCYDDAAKHLALVYESVNPDLNDLRGCLAAGFPFVFGFTAYASFESDYVARTGQVPMPHWFERAIGGHAVMAVGYDDASSTLTVRNSWGSSWGDAGYFYFPYAYATSSLASDFWTIRTVE